MSMILTAPVLLASLCVSPLGPQESGDPIRKWYELRDIVEAARLDPEVGIDLRTHLTSWHLDELDPEEYFSFGGGRESMNAGSVADVVQGALLATTGADVDSFSAQAGRLVLVGNERAHDVAAETLRVLRQATAESVTVDIHRLDGGQIPRTTGSHLDAEAAAELVAAIPGTLVARERVRAGVPASISDSEWSTMLHDYDVEVAQFAVAVDPTVTFVRSGMEVGVRVDRAADGRRFVVRTWGRDGALVGDPRTVLIESFGNAPIELPKVRTALWTASGIVEPGGALVVDHDGGGRSALVVRIGSDGQRPAPDGSVVPLGELGLIPMRVAIPELALVQPSGGREPLEEERAFAAAPWDDSPPASFAMGVIEPAIVDKTAAVLDSRILLFDPNLPGDELRADIDALRTDLRISTIEVDVRYDFVPGPELARVLLDGGPSAFAARAKNRLLGSVLEGDSMLLVGGVESAYLQDFDMQIAQAAVVGDPIIRVFFEGIAVWCAPFRGPSDGVSSWFDVRAQAGDSAIRGIETSLFVPSEKRVKASADQAGAFEESLWIELPVSHRASARTRIDARSGEWSLVAARRMAETDRALVVVARMSAQ